MRLNKKDQVAKEIIYHKADTTLKNVKITKILKKNGVDYMNEQIKHKLTMREIYEKEEYPDVDKLRVKAFKKLIYLLTCLKEVLKQLYPNDSGRVLIHRLKDLNPNEIIHQTDILEVLDISERSFYDYMNTLQMILDYSEY